MVLSETQCMRKRKSIAQNRPKLQLVTSFYLVALSFSINVDCWSPLPSTSRSDSTATRILLCVFLCLSKLLFVLNTIWQDGHGNAGSWPPWKHLMCFFSDWVVLKRLLQVSHLKGFSSECVAEWDSKWAGLLNSLPHSLHLYLQSESFASSSERNEGESCDFKLCSISVH